MTLQFVETLPEPDYGYEGVARQLRANPGAWALIAEGDKDNPRRGQYTAYYLTNKGSKHMPLTEYEVVLRNNACYARYLGDGEE